jgi:hypothetical protein
MKIILLVAAAALAGSGFAQNYEELVPDRLPTQPVVLDGTTPIEIQVVENTWWEYVSRIFSARQMVAGIGQAVLGVAPEMVLAQPTADLLREGGERRALEAEEFVNTGSSIFDRGSMRPAEWILRCSFGITATSQTRGGGIRVGNTDVGLGVEYGQSTAIARYELLRRRDMVVVGVVTVKEVYSSKNLNNFDFGRHAFFGRGIAAAFRESSGDPVRRRDLIATSRCLDRSWDAIEMLLGNRQ